MSTEADRFFAKVEKTNDCWLWRAATTVGYGVFKRATKVLVYAHRWSYEHHVGPIPEGLHIDHLCRVRACVNPAHLEPVTLAENNRRAGRHRRAASMAGAGR